MQTTTHTTTQPLTLVIGAKGKTGRRVLARLERAGLPCRGVSRSTPTPFDWHDRTTWPAALAGVKRAYITYHPDLAMPGADDDIRALADMAVTMGVERLVLLSGRGEPAARDCERIIEASGADWTVVRADWFMQNFDEGHFADMVRAGVIAMPQRTEGTAFVDADDIADVVFAALTEPGHAGEIYEVTGTRLLTFDDVAAELTEASGRRIAFVEVTAEAWIAGAVEAGESPEVAAFLVELMDMILDGRNAHLCDGVQRALGRPPRDFASYARSIAATGAWAA